MAKKRIKNIEPWDFVPANDDTRGLPTVGAGDYHGSGFKAKIGTLRESATSVPKFKNNLKKPLTQA